MRVSYSDDEEWPGQFELWQANCRRSRRGRKGQAALRELESALIAMPVQELHAVVLVEDSGEACAIGAMLVGRLISKGMSRVQAISECARLDPGDVEEHGVELGMPRLVAWSVAVKNDEYPAYETPTARYTRVLRWVQGELA